VDSPSDPDGNRNRWWNDIKKAKILKEYDILSTRGWSHAEKCRTLQVPEDTLKAWLFARKQLAQQCSNNEERQIVAFFQTPAGRICLKNIIAGFAFSASGKGGVGADIISKKSGIRYWYYTIIQNWPIFLYLSCR